MSMQRAGSDPEKLDLSGRWTGLYEDAADGRSVFFSALLADDDGWLTGTTEEAVCVEAGRRRLGASLQGRRVDRSVVWLKMYDYSLLTSRNRRMFVYDAVNYAGEVREDGTEIGGRWTVGVNWSGNFLMVRQAAATALSASVAREDIVLRVP